jgi:hypothetical protein
LSISTVAAVQSQGRGSVRSNSRLSFVENDFAPFGPNTGLAGSSPALFLCNNKLRQL